MPDDVFRWVIAIGVLLACVASVVQAIMLAGLYRAGKQAEEAAKEAQGKLGPLLKDFQSVLGNARRILDDNSARVAEISTEALAVTKSVRQSAERIGELIEDIGKRTRTRVAQIDRTVEQTVEQVEQLGDAVKTAVMTPAKEVSGFVNGVKAAVATYARNKHSVEHATQDEEMFI